MKFPWLLIAYAAFVFSGTVFADSAHARHKTVIHCVDRPTHFSLKRLLFGKKPQPNGCAPPVFLNGEYIGQDSDLNIRFQLFRDPDTGYTTRY